MKSIYAIFVFALLLCGSVSAQQPMKFGHINSSEIIAAMPELKEVETQLEAKFKEKEDQLTVMQEDLKAKQTEYEQSAAGLTPEQRAEKEQALIALNQKVQNFYMMSQQDLQRQQQELQMPIIKKVQTAIQEVGDEEGFLYIFELASRVPVYNSEKSIDVGPLVKAKLGIQ
ncbi:MAG: OmpH family outer membrane protein [Carboxylicivirga sp.]|jgi:outer membrane protein|nr:OmpH family outer membrane protein [Carboxylicivirga sp.]